MFSRKVKKGFASVMIGTMLLTQVVTPSLSNLARAEGINEEETTEKVDNKGSSQDKSVAETSNEVVDSNKDMLSEDFQPMSEMTASERETSLANVAAVPESSPTAAGGNNIERFTIEWRTQDNDGKPNNLHNVWGDNEEKSISYKMTYALSGQKDYAIGTINIKVPKTIFKDRNNNPIGYTDFGVPKAPDNNGYFAYTEVEDGYILTNTKRLKAASSGVIEATIKGLTPSEIKDFASSYQSDSLRADLRVTVAGGTMFLNSNRLISDVDTSARVYGAYLRHNTEVFSSFPKGWDERLKPANPDDYYYATFTTYASSQANQYFNVNLRVDMRASEDAKNAVVLGFKNARKDEVLLGDGTGVFDREIENNVYLKNGQNFSGVIYVAYPKNDFRDSRGYQLKGNVEFTMVGVDDKTVTKSTEEATLPFSPVKVDVPQGNFYVEKQGAGDITEWVNTLKKEGVYDTALNKLKARQDVDIRFDIQTRAYGGSYTLRDGGDPQNLADYGHKPYKLITDDYKTTFNDKDEELTSTDFNIKGLELSKKPLGRQFSALGDADVFENPFARKTFTAGDLGKPMFGYSKVDDSKLPIVKIFGKVNNGNDWVQYGTADYTSGLVVITPMNGARVEGSKILFPENVTDFKTEVETTLAHYVHDIQEIVTVKASDKLVTQIEELYTSGIAPKTYFANHVKLDVEHSGGTKMYINDFVARNQLHGFAYGIKPEKALIGYDNDTSKRKVDLTYELSATIQTNLSKEESVKKAVADGWFKEQTEGVFYDLLPQGVVPVTSTIEAVREGDSVVSVKATENYKGSGRTLLEIKTRQTPDYKYEYNSTKSILSTKGLYDQPKVRFKARLSWRDLKTYGAVLPNIMAYGSKHAIEGVKGLETETNPTTGKNTFTRLAFNNDEEKVWLNDLEFDGTKNFVYARKDSELVVDTSSVTSVLKEVDVNNENLWGDGLDESLAKNVYEGGRYNYSISMKNTDIARAKDVIFYDNLEKFKPLKAHADYGDMQWRGTYQGVNLDNLRKAGVEPVVYYSTKDNLVLDNDADRSDLDLTNTAIWTKDEPADKTKIRAIAIDARKKTDGSEFTLPENGELSANIEMRAPMAPSSDWYDKKLKQGEKETGLVGGGHAYNNVVVTSRQIATDTGRISDNLLVRHDYVKVGLKPYNLKFVKEWDDEDDRDGLRQKQATFELLANGKSTNKTVKVDDSTNWTGQFSNLPFLDKDGNQIIYTIVEKGMKGYSLKIKDTKVIDDGVEYTLSNKHVPEKVTIKGEKKWKDVTDSKRPESIEVTLKEDGKVKIRKTVKPDRDGHWYYEFSDLYKYRDKGEVINYTVEETNYVTGYAQSIEGFDIVNTYDPYTDVELTKKVENSTEASRAVNPDFTFVFKLVDDKGRPVMNEYEFETSLGRVGKVYHGKEFTLKADERIKIKRVDSDNEVSFEEIKYPKGYRISKVENAKQMLQAGRTVEATFTNKYESKGVANLDVSKTLEGRKLNPYEFRFSLLKDGEVVRTTGNTEDGKVGFGLLNFTTEDLGKTHVYKIREENNGLGGVTYDNHEEEVRIDLVDNGKGEITANVTYDADGAKFKNEYHASGKVNFKAWKQMLNGFKPENEQFSFELVDENNQVVATGKNDASGTITFSDINFTEKDVDRTFTFIAKEVQGNDDKVIYDNSTINYTVEVKDNFDGTLSLRTTARDNKVEDINNDINTPVFVNKYTDGKLSIKKKVNNGNPNQEFKFKVKLKGADGTIPKGTFELGRNALDSNGDVIPNRSTLQNLWSKLTDFLKVKDVKADNIEYKPIGNIIKTGTHGTVKWELYENGHLVFSPVSGNSGEFAERYSNVHGAFDNGKIVADDVYDKVKAITFKGTVVFPLKSMSLFSDFKNLESFNSLGVDTSKMHYAGSMFAGLNKLKYIDVTHFDVRNLIDTNNMFRGLSEVEVLDLSSFRGMSRHAFQSASGMFEGMTKVKRLDFSGFDFDDVTAFWVFVGVFKNATSLEEIILPNVDSQVLGDDIAQDAFVGLTNLKKITIPANGRNWLIDVTTLQDTRVAGYTERWVREDGSYGPITVQEMYDTWTADMAGVWVREKIDESYTIKFDTEGTGEQIPQMKAEPDIDVDLPTPTIRKPNSKFKGWSKTAGGAVLTKPIKNLVGKKETITLHAVWEDIDSSVNINNGEFEVSVFGNEQVTLKNLPAGLGYEVYELTTEGWVLVDENNTTGVIKPNENTVATFTNEYRPGEAQAKLQAKKLVDGKAANAKGYRFELVKDGNVLETVESTEDGTINFKNIRYNETGTFNYTIREVNDNKVGISYDTSVKNVSVVVTDLGNGKRQAEVKYEGDNIPVFNNTTQKTTLEVSKVVQGTEDATKDFNFKVTINGVEQVFTLKNGGKKVIEDLKVGDTYKVEEVNLPDGYSLVSITNAEGTIGSTQPVQVVATNKYNVHGSVELQAKKVLNGKELASGQFTFELVNSEGVVVDTAKNDANGNIYFNAIELTQAGVSNYKIREVKGSEDGITYDTHEESVRVVVTDNGTGGLTPEVTYDADGAVFTNTFTPPTVPPTTTTSDVTITKKVEGTVTSKAFNVKVEVLKDGKLLENTFNYTSSVGGRTGTLVSGNKLEIQGNEVITLSGVPVGATVKITEDEYKGYYVKGDSVLEKEVGVSDNNLVLTNVYEASGEVTFSGTKTLVGGDIKDYRFNFLVLRKGKVVQELTHDNAGKLDFKPIHFSNKDIGQTYEYEIIEDTGTDSKIDYDKTVYKVKVLVEDNEDGTLKLTTTNVSGDIQFNNVLRAELPLTGTIGVATVLSSLLGLLVVGILRRRQSNN